MSRIRLLKCMFDPNLKVVTSTGGDLLQGQTQNKVSFDLAKQSQSIHRTTGIVTKVVGISGPNLVILAWTGDKLSRDEARDRRTHTDTHTDTQTIALPEGQN